MRVNVRHTIGDLARDMGGISARAEADLGAVVRRNVYQGNRLAQRLSREKAGPHGTAFYKRMQPEMTGPLTGEYGPVGIPKSEFVGVGFRHGGTNTDLPRSADVQGPKMAADVRDLLDRWFW